MTSEKLLVLWDLDQTLLTPAGFGKRSMHAAFEHIFGRPAPLGVAFSGRTDHAILNEYIALAAAGSEQRIAELQRSAADFARHNANSFEQAGGAALPGALAALQLFSVEPRIVQSVLTGNLKAIGQIKLSKINAEKYLNLDLAVYGDQHQLRSELVVEAMNLASKKLGWEPAAQQVVLIGDTPLDLQAAKAVGTQVLGVATGEYSAQELHDAGADEVYESLEQADAMLQFLLGSQ